MVEQTVQKITDALIETGLITEEQKEDYVYALLCIVETTVGMGVILLIGIVIERLRETICFLVYFLLLRRRTGGIHLSTYIACCIGSLGIYACVICMTPWLSVHRFVFWSAILLSSIVILCIATVNHPNMHFDSKELYASQKYARITLVFELLVILIMTVMQNDFELVVYSGCGIIWCSILCLISKINGEEEKSDEEEHT